MFARRNRLVFLGLLLVTVTVLIWWTSRNGALLASLAPQTQTAARSMAPSGATECDGAFYNQAPRLANASADADARRFCHAFYEVGYSTSLRDPLWSAEHLTRDMASASDHFGRPKAAFVQQPELSSDEQGDSGDYVRSGYDRGHMTPANDAPDMDAETGTFVVTNIVPQTKELNERLWQYLEASVHRLAETEGDVYVVTGPIFPDNPERLGGRIAVPSETYKAIFIPARSVAVAYIATNADDPTCQVVSLAELRARAGVDAFPALPEEMKDAPPEFALPHGVHVMRGEEREVPLPDCA